MRSLGKFRLVRIGFTVFGGFTVLRDQTNFAKKWPRHKYEKPGVVISRGRRVAEEK